MFSFDFAFHPGVPRHAHAYTHTMQTLHALQQTHSLCPVLTAMVLVYASRVPTRRAQLAARYCDWKALLAVFIVLTSLNVKIA